MLKIAVVVACISLIASTLGSLNFLNSCPLSSGGAATVGGVDMQSKTYIYIKNEAQPSFVINVIHSNGNDILLRIKGNCADGSLVLSKKTGNTWKNMNEYSLPLLNCGEQDTLLIFVHSKKKRIIIGETPTIELAEKLAADEAGSTIEVKKGEVVNIGNGNICMEYPGNIHDCEEAKTWHESYETPFIDEIGDTHVRDYGFLTDFDRPLCNYDHSFQSAQIVGNTYFVCVDGTGDFYNDPIKINDAPASNITGFCSEYVENNYS